MTAELTFIGHIKTPYETLEDCPNNIRPDGPECQIVLDPKYHQGLTGLGPGQTILVLYWFEGVDRSRNLQERRGRADSELIGTFALRSPHRPNPVAAAMVPIQSINNGQITVRGLDCLDGTKLLDIKPAMG